MKPRLNAVLVGRSWTERYVSVRLLSPIDPEKIAFFGVVYVHSARRTLGGWPVYEERVR